MRLVKEHLNLADFRLIASSPRHLISSIVITADNLVFRGIAANFIVANAETNHVYPHVSRRLVRVGTINTFKECVEYGINLNVAIVVNCNLVVGFKVEGVNHVDIVEVGCCGLIGNVNGVL